MDLLIVSLFPVAGPFFLVPAGIQVLLTKLGIAIYLYQFILIHQIDISNPVLATQQKLVQLRSATLWVARLLFLQVPVWTTFYWSKSMLEHGSIALVVFQNNSYFFLFTLMAVWLFLNINYENRDKKWFRLIVNGKEWSAVIKSMELLREIHDYRTEDKAANQRTLLIGVNGLNKNLSTHI